MDQLPEREMNGLSDFPLIWNQQPRKGMQLRWNGNNTMVEECNKSAKFGTGTTPPTIDVAAIARIENRLLIRASQTCKGIVNSGFVFWQLEALGEVLDADHQERVAPPVKAASRSQISSSYRG